MDILSFSKITKPIYEGDTTIDCRPRGQWLVEIKRSDGTIRRPFGDNWVNNVFLNAWANNHMGVVGTNVNGSFGSPFFESRFTWLNFFYGQGSDPATGNLASFAVGSGTTPAQQTDTTLANQIRFDY